MTKADCNKWIKVTTEKIDGVDTLNCRLPDADEDILVSQNGYVWCDTLRADEEGVWLDSGDTMIDEIDAWMPLPEPYREENEK